MAVCVIIPHKKYRLQRNKTKTLGHTIHTDLFYLMLSLEKSDRVIINLKVLATLKEGERVCVRNGQFSLYSVGWTQSITRWMYKENRWMNFDDVQNVFNEAICILGTYMNMAVEAGNKAPHAALTAVDNIAKELHHAIAGLTQLGKTYCDDPLMVATLTVLIERTQTELAKAKTLLEQQNFTKLPAPVTTAVPAAAPGPVLPVAPQTISVHPKTREVVAKQ